MIRARNIAARLLPWLFGVDPSPAAASGPPVPAAPAESSGAAPAEARKKKFPNWRALVEGSPELWAEALAKRGDGPRVLFATSIGGHPQFTVIESALSIALTLRGARADALVCDGVLPACQRAKVSLPEPPQLVGYAMGETVCGPCVARARKIFSVPGLERLEMSAFLGPEDRQAARAIADSLPADELADHVHEGLPVGEHAKAGALRYYGVGDLSSEPEGELVLRRFLEASLLTVFAMRRLMQERRYDVVVTNHGIYVPHGVVNATAREQGARTVTWNTAYRRLCTIFSHDETYHHAMMSEPTSTWEEMAWSDAHEGEIVSYLESRQSGSRDWIWFNRDALRDVDAFAEASGLDWSRPVIGMLTNVVWDAQLHYPANAFPGMLDWVIKTIAYFGRRPDLQLLIRVHPGELAPPGGVTKSRQPVAEEIRKAFSDLPRNVFVIPPESALSTYAAMERCDSVIIYGTKTGVELTSQGIPVIVAGEAWIRNKGLTRDAADEADYFGVLDALPVGRRLDPKTVSRARRYAYHFFFRRMIPLSFLKYQPDQWPPFAVKLKQLDQLLPGRYAGLDVICDGILSGAPFIFPAERLGLHDGNSVASATGPEVGGGATARTAVDQ